MRFGNPCDFIFKKVKLETYRGHEPARHRGGACELTHYELAARLVVVLKRSSKEFTS